MSKHSDTIDCLVNRLLTKGYEIILKEKVYGMKIRGGIKRGEFDVLGIKGERAVYYEVKSNDTKKGYGKALVQFRRASPVIKRMGYRPCFVYVTPTKVLRVRF